MITRSCILALGLFLVCSFHRALAENNDPLRVLVWNVWHGTNDVEQGPEKALALIKQSKADICLLQESYDINGERPRFGPWAASQLKWNHWQSKSPHLCVLTRFTIKKTFFHHPWHAVGTELEDDHGRTLHALSIWLDYRSNIATYLKDHPDASDKDLLLSESSRSKRLKQCQEIIKFLESSSLTKLNTPLLVGGDWNCPSHLDWTTQTTAAFKTRRPLQLPVSIAMHEAGFSDTYRSVHPNPVSHPGNTWSPLFRQDKEGNPLPMNRIDRLYYKSNATRPLLKPIRATVFPEQLEDNATPIKKRLFPSDHAAVLIEFEWQPATTKK
ncbi:endonuclease/exonuclease/phosphatase family protein [Verrucomicrobiaceae bacterium N1E253]|uniref:Endonuclease/exonuclease/phosphatase family protein n=1 Tax=Oceaniferula marina TaxID=2748318 RepID=A0A851GMS2_9BACT|nr:endonuclease/exonuclease/phosphatase family protein [Oceaniferula marina]NWK56337.1 endonuclease/exonuclease/phosphatase family protein [Oceaniferula marina]